jgi:hypothetical protein
MEAPTLLLEQWTRQVKELFPKLHGHQQKGLAFAVLAMILAGHAVLQRMAEEISLQEMSEAKMPSIERRLQRFIANERIDVDRCWKHFLEQVLPKWAEQRGRAGAGLYTLSFHLHYSVLGLAGSSSCPAFGLEDHATTGEMGAGTVGTGPRIGGRSGSSLSIGQLYLDCGSRISLSGTHSDLPRSQVALRFADRLRTLGASKVTARLVGLAKWGTVHHTRRSAVVRLGFDLERAQLSSVSGRVLGARLRRSLDRHL